MRETGGWGLGVRYEKAMVCRDRRVRRRSCMVMKGGWARQGVVEGSEGVKG